jgi:16S rRNA (guanine1207-N2)-methyltransferase
MSPFPPLLDAAEARIQPPVAIVLGAPRLVAQLVERSRLPGTVCYQMDLYQAERLREEFASAQLQAEVRCAADLWELPSEFQTVLFPSPPRGERELKIDMVEQGFHILRPHGTFLTLSPIANDQFFAKLLKKIFGRAALSSLDEGTVIWSHREDERPRRRHEVTVQARIDEGEPLRFVTRPGVFAYGRLDLGARALLTAAEIAPGDRILDLGCGAGATGIAAARRAQPGGHVTFVDSNLRAIALAEMNARAAGLEGFQALAAVRPDELAPAAFDVVLTNPPYYAQQTITQMFIEQSSRALKPGGRFYLVTKQLDEVEPLVRAAFGEPELFESRGYIIIAARKAEA